MMKLSRLLGHAAGVATLSIGALSLTGCIDNDYNLDNVDRTIGFGSDGLGLKMGQTEKIYLNDVLDVDESVKTDGNNLYYLVESGGTDFTVRVPAVKVRLNASPLDIRQHVMTSERVASLLGQDSGGQANVPAGLTLGGQAEGSGITHLEVTDVSQSVERLKTIGTQPAPVSLSVNLVKSEGVSMELKSIDNLEVTLPAYMHVASCSAGWTLSGQKLTYNGTLSTQGGVICRLIVDRIDLADDGVPSGSVIKISKARATASFSGKANFVTTSAFTMGKSDYADISITMALEKGNSFVLGQVTGLYYPPVTPKIETIDVAGSLPDFLKDEAVRLPLSNPTMRLHTDLTDMPVGVNAGAQLTSEKTGEGAFTKTLALPPMPFAQGQMTKVYYYQTDGPYDPTSPVAGAASVKVDDLTSLVFRLPDHIYVNMAGGRIKLRDEYYTIVMDHDYTARAVYELYVPFAFDRGLTIVYNDSTNSLSDDLKDYTAQGIKLTATAGNTIPLNLDAIITAIDAEGRSVEGITFSTARIKASTDGHTEVSSQLSIEARLAQPELLRRIDRLCLKVQAASGESAESHQLVSTQYLQFKDVKLRLVGQVTGDFN